MIYKFAFLLVFFFIFSKHEPYKEEIEFFRAQIEIKRDIARSIINELKNENECNQSTHLHSEVVVRHCKRY